MFPLKNKKTGQFIFLKLAGVVRDARDRLRV
jgi:hypothetical protein